MEKNKKGQSQIVSTVLLILLVIATVVIVMGFVIPFVKDKLASGACLDVAGKIEISSGYTCYDVGDSEMQVQIGIEDIRELIDGFTIELGGASSESFRIENNTQVTDVNMFNGNPILELPPKDNTGRTYVISNIFDEPDFIEVYPILKGGKVCGGTSPVTSIEVC